jgi:hypothetical protein
VVAAAGDTAGRFPQCHLLLRTLRRTSSR